MQERIKKREELMKSGINPYPARVKRSHKISDVIKKFREISFKKKKVSLVGRIKSLRNQGNIIFMNIEDASGEIQILLKKDLIKNFKFIRKMLDIGDFISSTGILFKTKSGEKTLLSNGIKIVSKSLRPIPSNYYGIENTEIKLRNRYLDTILNKETKDLFIKKSLFWLKIREFLNKNGFIEVDTPVLEMIPGGADAEPFVTHHNALDQDFYLRISLEIALKKMLIGGFEKIYEIGRVFRNEGVDSQHLQDYMQLEFYWAYADYKELMKFVEKMYKYIIKNTFGVLKLKCDGKIIDWSKRWKVVDYVDIFKKKIGIDVLNVSEKELYKKAMEVGAKPDRIMGRGRIIDIIYKKVIRPTLIQPTFLVNLPVEISPLAKRSVEDERVTERIQVLACGTELGNGFSELNDPVDQRKRFEEQMKLREKGDKEAQRLDETFLEAMECGMPPAAGFGMSERLFAVLMNKPIREIVFIPPMKPKK